MPDGTVQWIDTDDGLVYPVVEGLVVCFSGVEPKVGRILDHEGCYGPHHEIGDEVP